MVDLEQKLANFKGCGRKLTAYDSSYWLKLRQIKAFGLQQAAVGTCLSPNHNRDVICGQDIIAGGAWIRTCDRCLKQLGFLW